MTTAFRASLRAYAARTRLRAETAAIDSIAERRALDLQQPRGLRLVAASDVQGPANETGLEFPHAIVERNGCDVVLRSGRGLNRRRAECALSRKNVFCNHDGCRKGNRRATGRNPVSGCGLSAGQTREGTGAGEFSAAAGEIDRVYFLATGFARSSSNFSMR